MPKLPIQWSTESTTIAELGDTRVVAYSRALRIGLLSKQHYGNGFIWNRPVAVSVEPAGEAAPGAGSAPPGAFPAQPVPVRDVTRIGMVALIGLGLAGSWLIQAAMRGRRRTKAVELQQARSKEKMP